MFTYQTPTREVLVGHEKRAYNLSRWEPWRTWGTYGHQLANMTVWCVQCYQVVYFSGGHVCWWTRRWSMSVTRAPSVCCTRRRRSTLRFTRRCRLTRRMSYFNCCWLSMTTSFNVSANIPPTPGISIPAWLIYWLIDWLIAIIPLSPGISTAKRYHSSYQCRYYWHPPTPVEIIWAMKFVLRLKEHIRTALCCIV